MKTLLAIVATLASALLVSGIEYDGLRVKFGWSEALADVEHFYKIPRNVSSVEAVGWRRTERPPGAMPELRMYCPPGRNVCPLYDAGGFVAGLQLALAVDEYESLAIKPERLFVKWRAPADDNEPARDYWTLTQYYVSEESLKAGAGPQMSNGATLQDGGVWVPGADGRLLRIPSTEAELNSTIFRKQNCIPNMGTHYYYNMTGSMRCEETQPWFALVTQGELVGTGMQVFGRLAHPTYQWFETPPSPRRSAEITIPFAPKCLLDWAESYGVVSLHIYYVDKPWNIRCSAGDSAHPAPVLDRLLLNGYRYANQISDELTKLFSG